MNRNMLPRIRAMAERLKKEYNAERVFLFGSYARGEETADSDIDLLVIAPVREPFFKRMAEVRTILHSLRRRVPFSPIVLTQEELEARLRIGDQFIEEIIQKGIEM